MVVDSGGGAVRADGWTNAIVFANVAVGLMALAVLCRPRARATWVVLAVVAGTIAVLLTGSRGAWPALAVLAAVSVMLASRRGRRPWPPRTLGLAACLLVALAALALPLTLQRMQALHMAVESYQAGERDTSYGARRDLLRVAAQALRTHPLTGVGIGDFERFLDTRTLCLRQDALVCELDHAHSELPQWAAAMGVPGLLAALLLYGVPLALFRRLLRDSRGTMGGAAAAGTLFVICFVLGGLSQSMFAHQLTASLYAILVGALTGFGVLEREAAAATAGDAARAADRRVR
jgi:O-antigen ligase